jgi:cytochrome oxidase assembly protein ShyY1
VNQLTTRGAFGLAATWAYRGYVRRLKFLLRPGWIALVFGVIIFAGACFWILSPWQFGRNNERESQIGAITSAEQAAPVPLTTMLPNGAEPTANQEWHPVTMSGHYLPQDETVARLRQVNDDPADEILTPFRLDNGATVLIDRGWVSPNNGQVPAYAPAPIGHVTLTARVHREESDAHRAPLTENGHKEIYSINTTTVTERTGVKLDPGYFTLVDNQPGVLNVLPMPQLDSGPFLSYALQWIVFGVMAIGGLSYFTWREIQPGGALTPEGRARRRAERAARAEEAARTGKPVKARKVRGRHAVAAMIAEEEALEQAKQAEKPGGVSVDGR